MIKNVSKLEIKISEKIYQFFCDQDSPLAEAKEALFQFQKFVGQIEDAVKAQQEQAAKEAEEKEAAEKAKAEEPKVEPLQASV